MYTHGNHGLKRKDNKNEFISIRDKADASPAPAETDHGLLYVDIDERYRRHKAQTGVSTFHNTIKATSALQLTNPVAHRYASRCTFDGRLDVESQARLLWLFSFTMVPWLAQLYQSR